MISRSRLCFGCYSKRPPINYLQVQKETRTNFARVLQNWVCSLAKLFSRRFFRFSGLFRSGWPALLLCRRRFFWCCFSATTSLFGLLLLGFALRRRCGFWRGHWSVALNSHL